MDSSTPTPYKACRTLLITLMAAPLIILLALANIVPLAITNEASIVLPAVGLIAYGLVMAFVVFPALAKPHPVPAGTPADRIEGVAMLNAQPYIILLFALSETPMIVSIALTFVMVGTGLSIFLVGLIVAAALCWKFWFPREEALAPVEAALNAEGVKTGFAKGVALF